MTAGASWDAEPLFDSIRRLCAEHTSGYVRSEYSCITASANGWLQPQTQISSTTTAH